MPYYLITITETREQQMLVEAGSATKAWDKSVHAENNSGWRVVGPLSVYCVEELGDLDGDEDYPEVVR